MCLLKGVEKNRRFQNSYTVSLSSANSLCKYYKCIMRSLIEFAY